MKDLKKQVEIVLKEEPATRNSDIALTIRVWQRFYPEKTIGGECSAVRFKDLYDLPREDNVKRIRAKFCQQGEKWAYPTLIGVALRRRILEEEWRRMLGYPPLSKGNDSQKRLI